MTSNAKTVDEYITNLDDTRKEAITNLRNTILKNLPKGYQEEISYGMVGYVVPHSLYPKGYHCDTKLPLPFMSFASQKNFIAFYHMGIYANPELLDWFVNEFPKHSKSKLDMGKSCIRFKKVNEIPLELIGELVAKMSVNEWIELYESAFRK
ncbi:MAG: DUF1801 domain-containing protein [Candidatus Kapaibacteriota bacterium]|jgi:hypothetical protein